MIEQKTTKQSKVRQSIYARGQHHPRGRVIDEIKPKALCPSQNRNSQVSELRKFRQTLSKLTSTTTRRIKEKTARYSAFRLPRYIIEVAS